MTFRFKNKSQSLSKNRALGVAITDNVITYIVLQAQKNFLKPAMFGIERLSAEAMQGGEVRNVEFVKRALRTIREKTGIADVYISIPETHVYVTLLPIPEGTSSVKSFIESHLSNHVPYSPEEYSFKYSVRGAAGNSVAHVSVFSKKAMRAYTDVFHGAGFKVLSIESEHEALIRTFSSFLNASTLVAYLGETSSSLFIMNSNEAVLLKTIPFGSETLIESISESLKVDHREGERILRTGFVKETEKVKEYNAVLKAWTVLTDELDSMIIHFHGEGKNLGIQSGVTDVILSGPLAAIPRIKEYAAQSLGVSVAVGAVWQNAFLDPSHIPELALNDSYSFSIPIGLVLKDLKMD